MLVVLINHPHGQEVLVLTISSALDRIKGDLGCRVPESLIRSLLSDLDHRHRDSLLTPVVTTYLFLQQILNNNISIAGLRRLSGMDFTPSAYCAKHEADCRSSSSDASVAPSSGVVATKLPLPAGVAIDWS